jgi:3-oxoacyl-[acyl-carrier protein] reductase
MGTLREEDAVMADDLVGQVAVVTGANHGIGAATAVPLARLGADVAATYFRLDLSRDAPGRPPQYAVMRAQDCKEVIEAISALGRRCVAIEEDLAEAGAAERIFNAAEGLGEVRILINNASGWRKDTFSDAEADWLSRVNHPVTEATIDAQLLVDARGGALMIAEFAERYRRQKSTSGRIVSLTSGGRDGFPGEVSYGAAKAALESYTLSAAKELAREGVTANIIYPPITDTGWVAAEVHDAVTRSDDHYHVAQPDEVAGVIAWLCTEPAQLVTGNVIRLR